MKSTIQRAESIDFLPTAKFIITVGNKVRATIGDRKIVGFFAMFPTWFTIINNPGAITRINIKL